MTLDNLQRCEFCRFVGSMDYVHGKSRRKMSIVSSLDFWIQSVASLFAVVNIWLLANGQIKLGCQIGLFGQLIFIYIFIDSQQYPLLLTDAILFGVYVKKLLQIKHYKHRRIQL